MVGERKVHILPIYGRQEPNREKEHLAMEETGLGRNDFLGLS